MYGTLSITVYRKPTHTEQYPQFDSHHPLIHKLGVIRTLQYRADTIISGNDRIPEEKDHVKGSLKNCGYPDWAFSKANKKKPANAAPNTGGGQSKTRVTLPYIAGISERVKNHLKTFGITTSFKPTNLLRGKVVHVKDKPPKEKQSNLVYGLKCKDSNCSAAYVGETKQAPKTRVSQHRRPSSNEAQNSAVYLHLNETGHKVDTDDAIILDREEQWHRRGVKEAIWERVEQPSLNKKGGLRFNLSHTWDRAIKNIPSRMSRDPPTAAQ